MRYFYTLVSLVLLSYRLHAYNVVVAKDGSGDVKTVQAAFDLVPANNSSTFTIFVKKGTYKEKLVLSSTKKNVSLYGEDKASTILTYDDWGNKSGVGGTDYTYSTSIAADNFYAENITFENTIDSRLTEYVTGGQAVALMLTGDKTTLYNCNIRGFQDTFYTKGLGRAYVKCCQIEGTTDFIFGAGIAVFENCLITNKKNSHTTAAANVTSANKYNYVFFNCKLVAAEGANSATLGRPWKAYAKVVYLYCEEGSHIKADGWADWSSESHSATAYFAEYKCTGAGFQPTLRLSWTHQLTDTEAANYTLAKIFAASAASPAYSSSWTPSVPNPNCSGILTDLPEVLSFSNSSVLVSPNPATTYLNLQFSSTTTGKASIQIYDRNGSLIKDLSKEISGGNGPIRMETEGLESGMYFYRITAGEEVGIGKFVVAKE